MTNNSWQRKVRAAIAVFLIGATGVTVTSDVPEPLPTIEKNGISGPQLGELPVPNNAKKLYESGKINELERDIITIAYNNNFSENKTTTLGDITIAFDGTQLYVTVAGHPFNSINEDYQGAITNLSDSIQPISLIPETSVTLWD